MNGLEIDEDTYKNLPVEDQRLAVFQNIVYVKKKFDAQTELCEGRFKKLEREKWYQRGAIGAAIGFFGLIRYLK